MSCDASDGPLGLGRSEVGCTPVKKSSTNWVNVMRSGIVLEVSRVEVSQQKASGEDEI